MGEIGFLAVVTEFEEGRAALDLSLYHAGRGDFDHGEFGIRFPESVEECRAYFEYVGCRVAPDDEMAAIGQGVWAGFFRDLVVECIRISWCPSHDGPPIRL